MAKQVTCDSCRRSFQVPDEIGDYWVLCPYCEKVNPRAQQDIQQARQAVSPNSQAWTVHGVVGTLLLIAGLLGGIFGTLLVLLGSFLGLMRRSNYLGYVLSAIWFVASVAVIVAGVILLHADSKGRLANSSWKALVVVLLTLIAGISGWVFVLDTCGSGFR